MSFDPGIYYGCIIKGDLHGAMDVLKQFPEQASLYERHRNVWEREQYRSYHIDGQLNGVLLAYQKYDRDCFYLQVDRERAAESLRDRLAAVVGIQKEDTELGELEQTHLPKLFRRHGLHFLGGKSGGYYGPYVWKTTRTVSYEVELPDGVQRYQVRLLDGFLSRSWIDDLSFGEIGPGGWADGDGIINCVQSAWDLESEAFRVSLLKHEAQHTRDLEANPDMSSEELEYRAKLVELIYSAERNLLAAFAQEADPGDTGNGHAMAAHRIMRGFADWLDLEELDPAMLPIAQIQTIARVLFEKSNEWSL